MRCAPTCHPQQDSLSDLAPRVHQIPAHPLPAAHHHRHHRSSPHSPRRSGPLAKAPPVPPSHMEARRPVRKAPPAGRSSLFGQHDPPSRDRRCTEARHNIRLPNRRPAQTLGARPYLNFTQIHSIVRAHEVTEKRTLRSTGERTHHRSHTSDARSIQRRRRRDARRPRGVGPQRRSSGRTAAKGAGENRTARGQQDPSRIHQAREHSASGRTARTPARAIPWRAPPLQRCTRLTAAHPPWQQPLHQQQPPPYRVGVCRTLPHQILHR